MPTPEHQEDYDDEYEKAFNEDMNDEADAETDEEEEAETADGTADSETAEEDAEDHRQPVTSFVDLTGTIKAARKSLKDLKLQYDEGDIDQDEYTDRKIELQAAITKAEITHEEQEKRYQDTWSRDLTSFLKKNDLYSDQVFYSALAGTLDRIGKTEAGQKMSNEALLKKAHAQVEKSLKARSGSTEKSKDKKPDTGGRKRKADDIHKHTISKGSGKVSPREADQSDFDAAFEEEAPPGLFD